jgi:hypothetical protein
MSIPDDQWRLVLSIAASQRGLVTWHQLETSGISHKVIRRLLATGWLRRVRRGVYAIGGQPPSPWEDAIAVGLIAGDGAALSHATAAAIHRFPGIVAPMRVEISVPVRRHPALERTTLHRVSRLDPIDIEERRGIRVTTRVRTMVDIAGQLSADLTARLVDEGGIARWWTAHDLLACVDRVDPCRKAVPRSLLSILSARDDEQAVDSVLERRVVDILAPYAPFEVHYEVVLDRQLVIVDIAWPQWLVAAEVDSFLIHGHSRRKFDHDRLRNNLLVAHGWRLAYLTSAMDARTILREVGRLLPAGAFVDRLIGRRA